VPQGTYEVRLELQAYATAGSFVACSITGSPTEEGGALAQFQAGAYESTIAIDEIVQDVSSITGGCRNLDAQASLYNVTLIATPIVDLHMQ
jgi:hypothetical protein